MPNPNGDDPRHSCARSMCDYHDKMAGFRLECQRLAKLADAKYRLDLTTPLYLVGLTAGGIWRRFDVLPEAPEGWRLVNGEALSRAATVEVHYGRIHGWLYREPVWMCADAAALAAAGDA